MARTYDLTDLAASDTTDADWALAYVRFALRDKPNDANAYPALSLLDAEILAALEANATEYESDTYYAAHRTAAKLLLGNPEWVQRYSAGGYSEEVRPASQIARDIVSAGAWIDAAISSATGGAVSVGQLRLSL